MTYHVTPAREHATACDVALGRAILKGKNREAMSIQDAAQRRHMASDHRRQFQIAIALKEYADMTGVHPDITAAALIMLRREGMIDCGRPATLRRFRELIDAIMLERATGGREDQRG